MCIRDSHWCVEQADRVGPRCAELIDTMLRDRVSERLRAAQGVLQLGKRFGRERLEAACARAMDHGSAHYRTVKTILTTGADQQPPLETNTPAAYRSARFARSAAELFDPPSTTLH